MTCGRRRLPRDRRLSAALASLSLVVRHHKPYKDGVNHPGWITPQLMARWGR